MSTASPVAVFSKTNSIISITSVAEKNVILDDDGDSVMVGDEDNASICEDKNEASHMEADEDEADPEMIECPLCGTITHISNKECKNTDCTLKFQFTETGHYKDGFVCSEDEVEYDEEEGESSETESEFDSDEDDEESSDAYENNSPSPWCKDEDEDWEP